MTTPAPPADGAEPMTLDEIRDLLAQTAKVSAENARAIAEMREAEAERATRHDREMTEMRAANAERAARHDREIAEIRALQTENARAMAEMRVSQERLDRRFGRFRESHRETRSSVAELCGEQRHTSNDVSTLKGWGMEFLCERRPGDFARALKLSAIELFPHSKMLSIAMDAAERGIVHGSDASDLSSGDFYFYGQRSEDDVPVYMIVQASFAVSRRDVKRASAQAETLETILRYEGPPEETGIALPVVAGTRLRVDPDTGATPALWEVTFVQLVNGDQLTA